MDLSEVYKGLQGAPAAYRLQSAVCYHGMHYHALVRQADSGRWLDLDDSSVTLLPSWAEAKARCVAGRSHPSLLFFEAQFAPQG